MLGALLLATSLAWTGAMPEPRDAPRASLPVVEANDNRLPGGRLADGTLTIDLVVQMARWYPEENDGAFAEVAALGEEGKAPQIPAPLIRVPVGTNVVATIRNSLGDSTIWVRGFGTRPSARDSIAIPPGEKRTVRFLAGQAGTYLYSASPGVVNHELIEREQMAGGLVVDPPGSAANDRIFVINIWGSPVDSTKYRNAVAINGKGWPFTERIQATVGDTLRWRVINASIRPHPMHLHGFYFRLKSRGGAFVDSIFAPDEQRLVVTEDLAAGTSMTLDWMADRPGNWLFHCHLAFHVLEGARLDAQREKHGHATDLMRHMAGLVMGINVKDRPGHSPAAATGPVRRLRMYATERPGTGRTPLHMSFVLQRGATPPAPDSVEPPGQLMLLRRGEPTEVTITNRSHAATSVHWHGIELESFSDGVAGWSGDGMKVAPMIAPNDSFTARLTLPRAGTFIYHTHLNDIEQLTSGMYGPIIVLEKGERLDPATDHIFTAGWNGAANPVQRLVNGDSVAREPLVIAAGKKHRFRFVNIGAAGAVRFAIRKDSVPVTWIRRAKDGADLPPVYRVEAPAIQRVTTGETFDAEWTPPGKGDYNLTVGGTSQWFYSRKITVR